MGTAVLGLNYITDSLGSAVPIWPLVPLLAIIPIAVWVGGWWLVTIRGQVMADRMRRTYELTFPRGMTQIQVLDFVTSILGELPRQRTLHPAYAVSFEKYADHEGKHYYLHVPGHVSTKVDKLLSKKIDGISIEVAERDPVHSTNWLETIEFTMRGTTTPLRISAASQVASSIDANFDDLDKDEALVMQWIIVPDIPRRPTPEDKDKVSEHTLHAVLRVGAVGEDANRNALNLMASIRSVNSHGSAFVRRHVIGVSGRIRRRDGILGFPIFLNATEFTALMGWELGGNTGPIVARKLPPSNMHDKEGITLGVSNHPKTRGRIIAMPHDAGDMHVRVMGGTGVGKSAFLLRYGLQAIMKPDTAFIMLEPAGDLAWDFLRRIPPHRVKDVIYLDPLDTDFPVGLNPLSGSDPERITSHVVSIFHNLSGKENWGHQLQRVLTTSVMTAALLGLTLYDVKQLLVNNEYRRAQLRRIKRSIYPEIFQEWDWIESKADITIDSSVNRLDSFLASRMIRNIVSQKGGLDFDQIIREHKILLVPLPAARMGQTNASAIGQLVREMAWNAAMKQDPANRQRSVVMMDEFQNFSDYSTSKSDPFAEARKYKQQYIIANQYTEQLGNDVQHTVDKNVATQIVFRLDPEDARKVKDRYKPLTEEDLSNLGRFHVAARIMTSTGMAPTVTFSTLPPPETTGFEGQIIAQTRRNYARAARDVDADILTRHKSGEPKRRPKIGQVD
jgi:hypothetical protein